MSSTRPTSPPRRPEPPLRPGEIVVAMVLAGSSGVGIIAHVLGPVPLSFSAPFVILPSAALLALAMLVGRGRADAVHALADRLSAGLVWGVAATAAYDAARPLVIGALGFSLDPYRAMPLFGHLITGRPTTDRLAIGAGWAYHSVNGVTFAMMLALVRPQGGWRAGVAWGLGLQALMLALYPSLMAVRVNDPEFLVTGVIGHIVWGIVLGEGLAWRARRATSAVRA